MCLTNERRRIFKGKIAGCYLARVALVHLIFPCKFVGYKALALAGIQATHEEKITIWRWHGQVKPSCAKMQINKHLFANGLDETLHSMNDLTGPYWRAKSARRLHCHGLTFC